MDTSLRLIQCFELLKLLAGLNVGRFYLKIWISDFSREIRSVSRSPGATLLKWEWTVSLLREYGRDLAVCFKDMGPTHTGLSFPVGEEVSGCCHWVQEFWV